jgi:hypothetical protein
MLKTPNYLFPGAGNKLLLSKVYYLDKDAESPKE